LFPAAHDQNARLIRHVQHHVRQVQRRVLHQHDRGNPNSAPASGPPRARSPA
jgi:hypothetical protein